MALAGEGTQLTNAGVQLREELTGLPQLALPIGLPRSNAKPANSQVQHILQGDGASWKMRRPGCRGELAKRCAQVHVGPGDPASCKRVPVVGEELGTIGVLESIGILLQAYHPGAARVVRLHDTVLHID